MNYKLLYLFLWMGIVSNTLLIAQDFNNYTITQCSGKIPDDFLRLSSEKSKIAMKEIRQKKMSRRERADESSYAVSSNFLVDELLTSGQVLFGDPMTIFVNRVADVLLESDITLRKNLRFYVYRSPVPNAYCTNTGIVLISIGLLARVENEAQMAFILAHEIQHFVKKHSLQQYKKAVQLKRDLHNISRIETDTRLKELYHFSKASESEADLLGYELMKKTAYDLKEGLVVFDMLRFSDYPFLEINLTADSLESANFVLPTSLDEKIAKLLQSQTTDPEEDENSEVATHPSLTERINALKDLLENNATFKVGSSFILSESDFLKMQRQARCELLHLYLRRADFGQVIYLARVMEKFYGATVFTDKIQAMGWYGLVMHKLSDENISTYGCNTYTAMGDWRPFLAALSAFNKEELGVLGMRELYILKRRNSGNSWFEKQCDLVFAKFQEVSEIQLDDFVGFQPVGDKITGGGDSTNEVPNPVVTNPRRRNNGDGQSGKREDWYYGAFYDLHDSLAFKSYCRKVTYEEPEGIPPMDIATERGKRKAAAAPAVKSLALFEPAFDQYDISGKGERKKKFFNEEQVERQMQHRLQNLGAIAEMPVEIISSSNNAYLTTNDINRYMVLNDWFMERLNNGMETMELWNGQFTRPIMDSIGTPYLGWVGFRMVITKRRFEPSMMLATLIAYPMFPFYLVWQVSREKEFSYAMLVFDTRNASLFSVQQNELSHRMKGDFLNAQLYQILYNVQFGESIK